MAGPAAAAAQKMQMIKGERHLFSSSDDVAMMKQILAIHAPDGRDVDVRPILHIVEDVFQHSKPTVLVTPLTQEVLDDKIMQHAGVAGCWRHLHSPFTGSLARSVTRRLVLQSSNKLCWDAKAVLAVAAFAVVYGEFWLTVQLHSVNSLAKSVAKLKLLPDILEHSDALWIAFDYCMNLQIICIEFLAVFLAFLHYFRSETSCK